MKLYIIRNKEGKFFRPVGFGGLISKNWQDSIEKAKFYPKIGTAKGQVSFWYKKYPSYGCPDILEFDIDPAKAVILDIKNETEKKIVKANLKKMRQRLEYEKWRNPEPKLH